MKVTCQACSAQYTIADEKVKGRKVKIRCKACQTPIVVDGQNPPPETAGGEPTDASKALDPFAPDTAIAGESDVWNVNLSDTDSRTMTTAEVIEAFRGGVVTVDAFVWKDGMVDWVAIMDCVELAPLLSGPTEPPAPVAGQTPFAPTAAVAAPTPAAALGPAPQVGGVPLLAGAAAGAPRAAGAARVATAAAQPAADLFGDIDVAGAEGDDADVATSARGVPLAPGATAYDDKPTGQRNENSVLFSLDAMKAGFSGGSATAAPPDQRSRPSAPKSGAPRAVQPSNPDDPFGMGAGAGLAGIGAGGNPLFSLNANQALLTAPAPPEPRTGAAPAVSEGPVARGGSDGKTKSAALFAGACVMILAVGVIMSRNHRTATAQEGSPSASSAQALSETTPKEPVKPEEKTEEKKAELPPAASTEDRKPEETKAEPAKPAVAKATTAHASAAAPAKKEEPAAAGPSTAAPFSKAAAIGALSGAASSAAGCKRAGGPTGVGKVQVSFAPSGRVTTATVMGAPFAGTAVGGCVAAAFRRAKVPPFSGNAVTVSKSFSIN